MSDSNKVAAEILSSPVSRVNESIAEQNHVEKFIVSVKSEGKIISFAPTLFMQLRKQIGISEPDLINSLLPVNNREQIFKSNKKTASGITSNEGGNSGSFFFSTEDNKYIVKTISKKEKQSLLFLLRDLCVHFSI
jgi:hypothetical protein